MHQAGLEPAPPTDRRTLIRRVTFDLLGLPPTPEEIERFVGDPSTDDAAWARLVDRLLASPHCGEQAARRWLDVARYADSSGFSNDFERGSAWRYRDYVVRSFNADKPFDRFIKEQIAGDELFPGDPEALVATGRFPLQLIGIGILIDGLGLVMMHALLGAGATGLVMKVSVGFQWLLFLPAAWLLGLPAPWTTPSSGLPRRKSTPSGTR